MGGINDHKYDTSPAIPNHNAVYIGNNNHPYMNNTFSGALALIFKHIKTNHPNVELIACNVPNVLGDSGTGTFAYDYPQKNRILLTPVDFGRAVIDSANFFSIPAIDVLANCRINHYNRTPYVVDHISLNDEGGKMVAGAIINGLINIEKVTIQ